MNQTAEAVPSADSTGAPYVAGNFAPLKSEVTSFDLEVIGHVPEELTGRFLRIGPNPIDDLDQVRLVRLRLDVQGNEHQTRADLLRPLISFSNR